MPRVSEQGNIRWLASGTVIAFALLAATMRMFLSEQMFRSAGLFTTLGMLPVHLVRFYGVVTLAPSA